MGEEQREGAQDELPQGVWGLAAGDEGERAGVGLRLARVDGDGALLLRDLLDAGQQGGARVDVLGAVEEHAGAEQAGAERDEAERPAPADGARHAADDDGRQEGGADQRERGDGDAQAALVHKVQIAHGGDQQRLEGQNADALQDARAQQRAVRRRLGGPHRAAEQAHAAGDVGVPLAVDARRRQQQRRRGSHADQLVARQARDRRKGRAVLHQQDKRVRRQDRPQRRRHHAPAAEQRKHHVALPQRPVERVARVLGRLRPVSAGAP
ncbi:hypothetical protein NEOLI_004959 [Neolecta irregularis DAH-3]|uniref:Uncharacterized protein n=1 Tax=Neolecta irregularis (strain DAH-3) TaxID=1198029 RepID=A0A1U7LMT7_NEOID|nr:hypothetical protein NEOLI_004959 [Neolecta irregularis DAH-3]|eukprot:OLL23957.1 hypothetical protein NEOLI_004959 [Neolecta irregularis DAH-3]